MIGGLNGAVTGRDGGVGRLCAGKAGASPLVGLASGVICATGTAEAEPAAARAAAFCIALSTASNNCAGVVLAFIRH